MCRYANFRCADEGLVALKNTKRALFHCGRSAAIADFNFSVILTKEGSVSSA
jgi:hypothetical protein